METLDEYPSSFLDPIHTPTILPTSTKPKFVPLRWPGKLSLHLPVIPHKIWSPGRKLKLKTRQRTQDASNNVKISSGEVDDITRLQTSFDVWASLRALRERRWTLWDLQHLVTLGYILFSLAILPPAPLVKTGALAVLGVLLLMPITRQFFLPSLPIWTYLLYFFASR
jgi:hypothetical protein